MSTQFRISKSLMKQITVNRILLDEALAEIVNLGEELESRTEELQDAYEDRSDRWKDGERALDVQDWLTDLEELVIEITEFGQTGINIIDRLNEFQDQPEYSS